MNHGLYQKGKNRLFLHLCTNMRPRSTHIWAETRYSQNFAKGKPEYEGVVEKIDAIVNQTMPVTGQYYYLMEAFSGAIEFGSPYMVMDNLKKGLEEKNDSLINKSLEQLKEVFADIHNKDYDHEVDRKVAKAIFPVYAEIIPAEQRPAFYQDIEKEFKGDYNAYIDAMYDNSILANQSNFDKFSL